MSIISAGIAERIRKEIMNQFLGTFFGSAFGTLIGMRMANRRNIKGLIGVLKNTKDDKGTNYEEAYKQGRYDERMDTMTKE
jgi:hypothetical protein